MYGANCYGFSTRFIFFRVMQRAEPKLIAMQEEANEMRELNKKDKKELIGMSNIIEELKQKLKHTEENLQRVELEIVRYKRCRLCLAGNMTPRTRENFVRKSMLKRFTGLGFGSDGREKSRAELFEETLVETVRETTYQKLQGEVENNQTKEIDRSTEVISLDDTKPILYVVPEKEPQKVAEVVELPEVKPSTVINFLRAALLKRAHRPTLDEAASQQIQSNLNPFVPRATTQREDRFVQTDDVLIIETSKYAKVLKRSASCPARLFWNEIYDPEKAARHKQWLIDNGMIPDKSGTMDGTDDDVEIVVASTIGNEEKGGEEITSGEMVNTDGKMKRHVNKLANETMDVLGQIGEELEGEAGMKVAALLNRWKKVARETSTFSIPSDADGGEGDDGEEAFDWDDGEGDDEGGVGKGRHRRKGKGKGKKEGEEGWDPQLSLSRKSLFDVATDVLKRSKRSTGKYTMGTFELGKTVPLGFAKMMDINKPPKVIKFFNARQLTKLITAIYTAKVEADILDDAVDGERQSSCEFVYDFMLNLYGLKRLAESAVWGLFKKISILRAKKEIEKCHKARIFNRFCGMDETKYYSERDLYLYLKVMSKGIATSGLFYPSELDDGISYVNCVWVEALASEPTLIAYLGSQVIALDFIQKFVATHATIDKVSLEVKKITKSEKVKRIDFDELMEAIFEKGAVDSMVVQIPKKPKKGIPMKSPLTAEQRVALENLFTAGDANQDGVLTFTEFREIINSANPAMSQQNALRMFRETLLLEPEGGDKISPAAFATVAHKHDITAPPPVIFNLLRKTWLQIQADVNENKIKDEGAKKESDELRTKVATLVDIANDTNGAVQAFKEYVLKFCGEFKDEEDEDTEKEEEEEEVTEEDDHEPMQEEELPSIGEEEPNKGS